MALAINASNVYVHRQQVLFFLFALKLFHLLHNKVQRVTTGLPPTHPAGLLLKKPAITTDHAPVSPEGIEPLFIECNKYNFSS